MRKVLVVDDDADLLEMVELALVSHGLKVQCLHQGADLFEKIDEERPDTILMDIYLGDSDGRDLCHKLKTSREYQSIPVILYSAGQITAGSIHESLADDFMVKPFDIKKLIEKLQAVK